MAISSSADELTSALVDIEAHDERCPGLVAGPFGRRIDQAGFLAQPALAEQATSRVQVEPTGGRARRGMPPPINAPWSQRMTSVAFAMTAGEMVTPIVCAAFKLTTSSSSLGALIGRS